MAAIALTFATAACTQHRDGETRTLRLSTYSEPPGFDPLVSDNAYLQDFAPILHGFLLRTEADGGFTPDLVARVPTLRNGDLRADGRSIRYRLRRGVRWQDGAPFDARDVVFSFAAARNPRNNVPDRSGFDDVASVVALGPYDVEVRLRRPFSPALATFFSDGANDPYPILPAHLLASLPQLNDAAYNGRPIGLGPYRLERWERVLVSSSSQIHTTASAPRASRASKCASSPTIIRSSHYGRHVPSISYSCADFRPAARCWTALAALRACTNIFRITISSTT